MGQVHAEVAHAPAEVLPVAQGIGHVLDVVAQRQTGAWAIPAEGHTALRMEPSAAAVVRVPDTLRCVQLFAVERGTDAQRQGAGEEPVAGHHEGVRITTHHAEVKEGAALELQRGVELGQQRRRHQGGVRSDVIVREVPSEQPGTGALPLPGVLVEGRPVAEPLVVEHVQRAEPEVGLPDVPTVGHGRRHIPTQGVLRSPIDVVALVGLEEQVHHPLAAEHVPLRIEVLGAALRLIIAVQELEADADVEREGPVAGPEAQVHLVVGAVHQLTAGVAVREGEAVGLRAGVKPACQDMRVVQHIRGVVAPIAGRQGKLYLCTGRGHRAKDQDGHRHGSHGRKVRGAQRTNVADSLRPGPVSRAMNTPRAMSCSGTSAIPEERSTHRCRQILPVASTTSNW